MSVAYIDTNRNPNSNEYLTILWRDVKTNVTHVDYSVSSMNQTMGILQNSLQTNNVIPIDKDVPINYFKKIAQFFSYSYSPYINHRVTSAVDQILASRKVTDQTIYDIFINNATEYLDSTAIKMGFPTPSQFYSELSPSGNGVNPDMFIANFKEAIEQKFVAEKVKVNKQRLVKNGLVLKIVESDTDEYQSEIPFRRVEDGFSYTDYVYNDIADRKFSCVLFSSSDRGITETKELLLSIRKSKEPFDIVVYDGNSSELVQNCLFSGLSFNRDVSMGDTLQAQLSIRPIKKSEQLKTTQVSELRNSETTDKNTKTSTEQNGNKQGENTNPPLTISTGEAVKDIVSGANNAVLNVVGAIVDVFSLNNNNVPKQTRIGL